MPYPVVCGIYSLNFEGTGHLYIGQSINIYKRFSEHLYHLKNGTHQEKLTKAYSAYGMPDLRILIECKPEDLDQLEKEAINIFDSVNFGFNCTEHVGKPLALKGEENYWSLYTNDTYEKIFLALVRFDRPTSDICKEFNVSLSVVRSIASGHNHKWLAEKYPDEYMLLLSNKGKWNNKYAFTKTPIKLISPSNEVVVLSCSISSFAKLHNLHPGHLGKVISGEHLSHKGWKLFKDS